MSIKGWSKCEKCSALFPERYNALHSSDCPPNKTTRNYGFVKEKVLHAKLDIQNSTENIPQHFEGNDDCIVFLSRDVADLCSLALGDWALIRVTDNSQPAVAKLVWPTIEKSLTSVLMTKDGIDTSFPLNSSVSLCKFSKDTKTAKNITVVLLNKSKNFEIPRELTLRVRKKIKDRGRPITKGNKINVTFYAKVYKFQIEEIQSDVGDNLDFELGKLDLNETFYTADDCTNVTVYKDESAYVEAKEKSLDPLLEIGGLKDEIDEILDLLHIHLKPPRNPLFVGKGHSVLLYGSSGTGKTFLAEAVAKQSKANVLSISPSTLYSGEGNIENIISDTFKEALEHAPSVIIIDNIDQLCPSWSNRLTDSDKRISATILKNLSDLNKQVKPRVFVIATSNKPDAIDLSLRRCGILDREIELPVPNPKARKEILVKLLENTMYDLNDDSLNSIALNSHGFVGADLVSLCSRVSLIVHKRNGSAVTIDDFKQALKVVRPSAMREVQIESPNVKWSDIGGQKDLKLILKQAVEWPLKYPESFIRLGVSPPRGVLMYGPPGCSKTMIAKALATESGLNFLSIKGPELFSKWVGESERAVREVFRKASQVAPSIIFFDEIDALGSERTSGSSSTSVQDRVLAQLLTELDGITPLGDVTIVAATNRPDKIDKALLRPGRLDRIVYVPLPNAETRRHIFRIKLAKMPVLDVDVEELVRQTDFYSGAEINAVCHEAAMMALEESLEAQLVEGRHFEKALKLITPRTPHSLLELYDNYQKMKT